LSTPAVRHLARKEGVDINKVHGTGRNGRVTKGDLLSFISSGHGTASQAATPPSSGETITVVRGGPRIAKLEGITEQDTYVRPYTLRLHLLITIPFVFAALRKLLA